MKKTLDLKLIIFLPFIQCGIVFGSQEQSSSQVNQNLSNFESINENIDIIRDDDNPIKITRPNNSGQVNLLSVIQQPRLTNLAIVSKDSSDVFCQTAHGVENQMQSAGLNGINQPLKTCAKYFYAEELRKKCREKLKNIGKEYEGFGDRRYHNTILKVNQGKIEIFNKLICTSYEDADMLKISETSDIAMPTNQLSFRDLKKLIELDSKKIISLFYRSLKFNETHKFIKEKILRIYKLQEMCIKQLK